MLENGDLIFVKDLSDIGQAIQDSTGNYSHVAIFLDGLIYHASGQAGVICQEPADFFEPTHLSQKSNRHFLTCFTPRKKGAETPFDISQTSLS